MARVADNIRSAETDAKSKQQAEGMAFWREHDARLVELVAGGATTFETAAILGTSKNAVIGRAQRIGLSWARSRNDGGNSPIRTLFDRLQAIHDRFDAVQRESGRKPAHYQKAPPIADATGF